MTEKRDLFGGRIDPYNPFDPARIDVLKIKTDALEKLSASHPNLSEDVRQAIVENLKGMGSYTAQTITGFGGLLTAHPELKESDKQLKAILETIGKAGGGLGVTVTEIGKLLTNHPELKLKENAERFNNILETAGKAESYAPDTIASVDNLLTDHPRLTDDRLKDILKASLAPRHSANACYVIDAAGKLLTNHPDLENEQFKAILETAGKAGNHAPDAITSFTELLTHHPDLKLKKKEERFNAILDQAGEAGYDGASKKIARADKSLTRRENLLSLGGLFRRHHHVSAERTGEKVEDKVQV